MFQPLPLAHNNLISNWEKVIVTRLPKRNPRLHSDWLESISKPIGGNIPESNFYIKPETKAFRFPVFVFRIPADFSNLTIADISISSEYTPMCMLIFLLYIPYSVRSMQSTNILYANCNLSPILSTCCVRIRVYLYSNNLENHSKIYFSVRSSDRNNFLFFSFNRS